MEINKRFWKGKKILITGNTGFKGSWLTLVLKTLNANIYGYSLRPKKKSLFNQLKLNKKINCEFENILNYSKLKKTIERIKPDIIFHLAAQPLVDASYLNPLQTYKTNFIGTLNILDILRVVNNKTTLINITSDKVYFNNETEKSFTEEDRLCGKDPYSNSKSCVELLSYGFLNSFFKNSNIKIRNARSGNVIGGGDWHKGRLFPDIIQAHNTKKNLEIKNLQSVRPWQYILDCIFGYLILAQKSDQLKLSDKNFAFNFSSGKKNEISVKKLIEIFIKVSNTKTLKIINSSLLLKESKILRLNSKKSKDILNWYSQYNIHETIKYSYEWYDNFYKKHDMYNFSINHIKNELKNKNRY